MSNQQPHLVIIDGFSFLFRAYHAVRPLTRSDGLHTNALFGFSQMLIKVIGDLQPDLCAVALDSIKPTFRKEMYPDYKAHRPPMDPEMAEQLPYFERLIDAFGIQGVRVEGVEADDIIATMATNYRDDMKITIVSSDKDLMQLLGGSVSMLDTMKSRTFGPEQVVEKFGVGPDKVIEVQALIGDSSDNIPGVRGVGPKTAAQLIQQFGSIDAMYDNLDEVVRDKLRVSLAESEDDARISKELVTLKVDVNIEVSKDLLKLSPTLEKAQKFLDELEFNTLSKRLSSANSKLTHLNGDMSKTPDIPPEAKKEAVRKDYETITTKEQLAKWLKRLKADGQFSIDTETNSLNAKSASLVGISLAATNGDACYIPLTHGLENTDLLSDAAPEQLDKAYVVNELTPLVSDNLLTKVGQNIKYDLLVLEKEALVFENIDDTMLMSFCLDGGKHGHGMDDLALRHLNHECIPFKEVCGVGKSQITFDQVPLDQATPYAAEDAEITQRLYDLFKERLNAKGKESLRKLYEEVERPLVQTLVNMESCGILIDRGQLEKISLEFFEEIQKLEKSIHDKVGKAFNVNSPKQLSEILFNEMGLTVKGKKPKSTNVAVMEQLADEGHDVAADILQFRQLSKLRSTYCEALVKQINPETGRVHTSYNQAGAATGRFSSSDPNLQNIPIRTENGRRIRHCFIAKPGHVLMAADYSQIELRLLAHASGSKPLQAAFNAGKDIHTHTAHQIFDVPEAEVTSDHRRIAKSINFGLVYGMGAVSLSKQIGVSRHEAMDYIERYFERYDGIRDYMDQNKAFAHEHGYVETLYGRRVHLPDINSSHQGLKAGAERAAINAPLQGSNADIMKMVMPKIETALKDAGLEAKMLLQVHDELVFEVPESEVETTATLVKEQMESIVSLSVPLKVETGTGKNWEDAH